MDSNPIHHPSPVKKWNAHFWIMFNFWWTAGLVNGIKPHLPPVSSQRMKCLFLDYVQLLMIGEAGWWTWSPSTTPLPPKNEMLIFGLCSTSDDRPSWSMDSNPSATPLQAKKWNAHFWITFIFWWSAGLVDGLEPHLPPLSSQKNEMLVFVLHSTSDDRPGWLMDLNQIHHPSPAKKWNAHFWITFNFWWSAGLVDGLKPHLPPLSSQKNEMIIFQSCSTSDDWPGWLMDLSPICHPSPTKKMKCSFLDYVQLLMIGWAGRWTQTPSTTPVQEKNDMLIFVLHSTSHDQQGWLMDLNPICHPSPARKMKCLFLDYIQILMIGWAGRWTQTPSATPLQPKKWNAHFWITFNFWWLAGLVNGCKSHLPPLSSQKMKCWFLDYVQLLMIGLAGWWTWTPSTTSLQPKKWKSHFWITFIFWWSAGLVDGLEPHLPPLSSQKNEVLVFVLHSTSDDRPGWLMDPNQIHHPSPAKKWNAHFWITFNFWWSAGLVDGLKPHFPPLSSQKNEMIIFQSCSTSDDRPGWLMDLSPICHPSPTKKMKCSFLDYVQLLMIGWAGRWTQTPSTTPVQEKNDMLIFVLHSTSHDQLGWLMDSNPICNPYPVKKMKCSFLDYIQLLMIGRAGWRTWTPSATHLQPEKWNACFWITFKFWWLAGLVDELKPHLPPLSSQKKWNADFWITFNFWWSA